MWTLIWQIFVAKIKAYFLYILLAFSSKNKYVPINNRTWAVCIYLFRIGTHNGLKSILKDLSYFNATSARYPWYIFPLILFDLRKESPRKMTWICIQPTFQITTMGPRSKYIIQIVTWCETTSSWPRCTSNINI